MYKTLYMYKGIKFIIMCQPPPPLPLEKKMKKIAESRIKQCIIWIQIIIIILQDDIRVNVSSIMNSLEITDEILIYLQR